MNGPWRTLLRTAESDGACQIPVAQYRRVLIQVTGE